MKNYLLIFLNLITFCDSLFSEAIPGVLQSLEKVQEVSETKIKTLSQKTLSNPKVLDGITNKKSVQLDSQFLTSLLMFSQQKYLKLAKNDECFFYLLMENGLLKNSNGPVQNVIIRHTSSKNKIESAIIPTSDFLDIIYSYKCIQNKEIDSLYTKKEFLNTIKNLDYKIPQKATDCEPIVESWKKNPNLIFLCKMHETFIEARNLQNKTKPVPRDSEAKLEYATNLKQKLTPFQYQYINRLCENLESPEKFCDKYTSNSFWQKIISGEKPVSYFEANCRALLKKTTLLSQNDLMACDLKLENEPLYCQYSGASLFPSLVPKPSCDNISMALNQSHLKADYHDCPGKILNEGVVTGSRIISHLQDKSVPIQPENCANAPQSLFASLNLDNGNSLGWGLTLCYPDKIEKRNTCFPIFLNNYNGNQYSEGVVTAKILAKTIGADEKRICTVVSDKEYNPAKLQYRNGCFLIYDSFNCTATNCPKKVIYNERELKNTEYEGKVAIDLFPNNYKTEKFSFLNIVSEALKKTKKLIFNMTQMKSFFKDHKMGIIMGVGCSEDIYPNFFKRTSLNQCSPLSFIVDGEFTLDQKIYLIVRTGIDDVQSPRIINWNLMLSSIRNYQTVHPFKSVESLWSILSSLFYFGHLTSSRLTICRNFLLSRILKKLNLSPKMENMSITKRLPAI
ncbi:MAG: hypothetical protein U0T83_09465 [Bacteriovoracaceae bacterium]